MIIKLTRGCIVGGLDVDGKDECKLTDEERQKVLDSIHAHLKPEDLNIVLQVLAEQFGEYDYDDRPCETCGDIVEWWTWEI